MTSMTHKDKLPLSLQAHLGGECDFTPFTLSFVPNDPRLAEVC